MSFVEKYFHFQSRKWVQVMGLIQITVILPGTIVFALLTNFTSLWTPGKLSGSEREVVAYRFFVLLCFVVSLISTAAIIYENKKERAGYLRTWIFTNYVFVLTTAIGVFAAREDLMHISYAAFNVIVGGSFTYAVHRRVQEIKAPRLQFAVNV